jgi:hypothetical protein
MISIFDDGTIESKLLRYELEQNKEEEIKVIETVYKPEDIESYLSQAKGMIVYLHFCKEDFLKYDMDGQRNRLRDEYPTVFFAYQFIRKEDAKQRALAAKIQLQPNFDPITKGDIVTVKKSKKKKEKN